jgi:hypothetical protein
VDPVDKRALTAADTLDAVEVVDHFVGYGDVR